MISTDRKVEMLTLAKTIADALSHYFGQQITIYEQFDPFAISADEARNEAIKRVGGRLRQVFESGKCQFDRMTEEERKFFDNLLRTIKENLFK
ncbi:MAG: hypothetical protein WC517_01540 [Patescibacteria group bacterium]